MPQTAVAFNVQSKELQKSITSLKDGGKGRTGYMCGLSGLAGTIEANHDPVFRDLLYFNALRGEDSTGVGGVYRDYQQFEPQWYKVMGGAWNMLDDKRFDKFIHYYYCCLLGHNRSPTVGASSIRNAHPFLHSGKYSSRILGMHNGTLEGGTKMDMKDYKNFGTDSEGIINNIAFEGPEKTIAKLDGAWALVWYDQDRHTINMIRNDKRPLVFTLAKNQRTLLWSSEPWSLKAATSRHGIETEDIHILPVNRLFSWKVPEWNKEFEAPVELSMEGKKHPNFTYTTSGAHGYVTPNSIRSHFHGSNTGNPANPTKTSGNTSTADGSTATGKQKSAYKGISTIHPFVGLHNYGIQNGGFYVFYDPKKDHWIQTKWDTGGQGFSEPVYMPFAPGYLPFSQLDVNSNHQFKHVGKKKKKQIFMRGWHDTLLSKNKMEEVFGYGCVGCNRVPQWGNPVTFLNNKQEFLCEFCAVSEPMVKSWKEA